MTRILSIAAALLLIAANAFADRTTGGINWLDPLGYAKPVFVSIEVPNEAAAPKYYVDLSSGAGTACTQAAPCAMAGLGGKPGLSGGPAYVYLKGTGGIYLYNPGAPFYGSAGNPVVFKPWPAGTAGCPSGCTATVLNSGVSNITGSNIHHWVFDGGPDMGIKFLTTDDNRNYALRIDADDITMYRVQGTCNNNRGALIFATNAGEARNLQVINSEFYDCVGGAGLQQSAIYMGASTCNDNASGFSNFRWINNILRNFGGEGIELNPRTDSVGATIAGSAFHNIGKQTCAGSWDCRPVVTIDGPSCGGSSANVTIADNLMWDIGGACIWSGGGAPGHAFSNNTCYDYGKGVAHGVCQQGICKTTPATVTNNIIVSPTGVNPFAGSHTLSGNLCAPDEACGAASRTWSPNTVLSTTPNDPNFMRPGAASEAKGAGANLFAAGVTLDYAGLTRPASGAFDLGAFMFRPGPAAPTNVRVVR